MIRFICDTVSSESDTHGNRYHFATITSTRTGRELRVTSIGGDSNAPGLLREAGLEWSEIHYGQSTEMKRRWKQLNDHHQPGALYEHQVTSAAILDLETEARQ